MPYAVLPRYHFRTFGTLVPVGYRHPGAVFRTDVDFNLYQALREARPLVDERGGEPWDRLRDVLDEVFAALALDVDDVTYGRDADRIDRGELHDNPYKAVTRPGQVDSEAQEQVIAALHALYNQPSESTARSATTALEDLRGKLGS